MSVALCQAPEEASDVMSTGLANLRGMVGGLDDNGIVQALRDIETHLRQTQAVMLDLVAEAETRRIAAREGFGGTA
jgi:hypothetical protein